MLPLLTKYLSATYPIFNIFNNIIFCAIGSLLTAFIITLLISPYIINKLALLNIKQIIRNDGPHSHLKKIGTPTMGGLLIISSLIISILIWIDLNNYYIWCLNIIWNNRIYR